MSGSDEAVGGLRRGLFDLVKLCRGEAVIPELLQKLIVRSLVDPSRALVDRIFDPRAARKVADAQAVGRSDSPTNVGAPG